MYVFTYKQIHSIQYATCTQYTVCIGQHRKFFLDVSLIWKINVSLNCQLNAISDRQSSFGVCWNSQPESYAGNRLKQQNLTVCLWTLWLEIYLIFYWNSRKIWNIENWFIWKFDGMQFLNKIRNFRYFDSFSPPYFATRFVEFESKVLA